MKPKWRSVAERAYNSAHGIDEISAAMMPALHRDCQDELSPRFIDGLCKLYKRQEGLLFKDSSAAQLDDLRREAGTGIGRHVLENVVRLSKQEEPNVFTVVKAFERALTDRLAKNNRQMEEHMLRKSTVLRANQIRRRLEQATAEAKAQITGLSRQVLKLDNSKPANTTSKRDGLDEGPSIK